MTSSNKEFYPQKSKTIKFSQTIFSTDKYFVIKNITGLMSTDLFGQYFNNPTKSYIYTNLKCNGESADEMSFDITGSDGVISNNENILTKIGLDEIHVPITQYTNDMKIINPYSFIYVKGITHGEAYTSKYYGVLGQATLEIEDWMYRTTMILHLKYVNELGMKVIKCIYAGGSLEDDRTFLEAAQDIFDELNIPIQVACEDAYITFTSTSLGYDFWVSHIELWHYLGDATIEEDYPALLEPHDSTDTSNNEYGFGYDSGWQDSTSTVYSSGAPESVNAYTTAISEADYQAIYNAKYLEMTQSRGASFYSDSSVEFTDADMMDVSTNILRNVFLFEDLTKYVPCMKYRNGAMKGCLVVATYPIFNADSIADTQRALKIGHLVDRVEEFFTSPQNQFSGLPMYVRVVRDVVDSYYSQYEFDVFKKWSNGYSYMSKNDSWIDPGEIPVVNLDNHDAQWTHSHVPNEFMLNSIYKDEAKYDAIGLYGYANYLSKTNGWSVMGQVYLRTTVEDDESNNTRNLIPSFLIYNPNPFPVTVKYLTFI